MSLSTVTNFDETSTTDAEFDAQKIVLANSNVLSTDVNVVVERALRRTKRLDDKKANLSGATFTGAVIFNSTIETNSTAQLDGAVIFNSTIETNSTAQLDGAVTVNGALTTNSTFEANGSAQFDGATTVTHALGVALTGTQPAATANPGANNIIVATNIAKCWGVFYLFGSGPYTPDDGYNINTIALTGANILTVTFKRAMASANFSVTMGVEGIAHLAYILPGTKTVNGFDFSVIDTVTNTVGGSGTTVSFHVFGRQS